MESPRHVQNRRRRTREGPEPACVLPPKCVGWHTQGVKDELTSCRGYRLVGVAIPPVSREGGRAGLPKKGKWPPRGTGTTVLTYPCPSQPCFGGSKGRPRVTQASLLKAVNIQVRWGGSSPWTRPSAPECGDILKTLAGDLRPI